MRKFKQDNYTSIIFDSINEVVKYNRGTERTPHYKKYHVSDRMGKGYEKFTSTSSYEEAEDLLLHGWNSKSYELTKALKSPSSALKRQIRNTYSVAGYQPCVPRYLQGLPDSMIDHKVITVKSKIVNIVKDIGYAGYVKAETMENESLKVLKFVQSLESKGYRANLYISFVSDVPYTSKKFNMQIKIKDSGQKLNIKQVAFPLVHPSMFRRIVFGLIERLEETKNFGNGYGKCTEYAEVKHLFKGNIYIPRIVDEQEIVDVNKYMVK